MYETTDLRQAIECKPGPGLRPGDAGPAPGVVPGRSPGRRVLCPGRLRRRRLLGRRPGPGRPRQGHPGRHGRPDRRLRPPVRPDGRVPCFHCAVCDAGAFARCAKALAPAEARLHAGQAVDADRVRTSATVAELEMLVVELSAGLG
jgi:hypothetical protein